MTSNSRGLSEATPSGHHHTHTNRILKGCHRSPPNRWHTYRRAISCAQSISGGIAPLNPRLLAGMPPASQWNPRITTSRIHPSDQHKKSPTQRDNLYPPDPAGHHPPHPGGMASNSRGLSEAIPPGQRHPHKSHPERMPSIPIPKGWHPIAGGVEQSDTPGQHHTSKSHPERMPSIPIPKGWHPIAGG